jgi:hypothetical protein
VDITSTSRPQASPSVVQFQGIIDRILRDQAGPGPRDSLWPTFIVEIEFPAPSLLPL